MRGHPSLQRGGVLEIWDIEDLNLLGKHIQGCFRQYGCQEQAIHIAVFRMPVLHVKIISRGCRYRFLSL